MIDFFLESLFWASVVLAVLTVVMFIADWWIMHQGLKRWEDDED